MSRREQHPIETRVFRSRSDARALALFGGVMAVIAAGGYVTYAEDRASAWEFLLPTACAVMAGTFLLNALRPYVSISQTSVTVQRAVGRDTFQVDEVRHFATRTGRIWRWVGQQADFTALIEASGREHRLPSVAAAGQGVDDLNAQLSSVRGFAVVDAELREQAEDPNPREQWELIRAAFLHSMASAAVLAVLVGPVFNVVSLPIAAIVLVLYLVAGAAWLRYFARKRDTALLEGSSTTDSVS